MTAGYAAGSRHGDSINGHRRALVSPSTGPHAPDRFLSIENVRWRNQDFVQVFEFPTHVGHSKSQPDDGKPSLNGAWSESRAPFLNFTPRKYFCNYSDCKFCTLVTGMLPEDRQPPELGMVNVMYLLNFWQISVNVETAQDRDIITMENK